MRIALWLAVVTWFGELSVQLARKYLWGMLHLIYPSVLLLGPIAYFLLFAVSGLVILGLHHWRPRFVSSFLAVGALEFLAVSSVLAIFKGKVGTISTLILAVGIASQLTRLTLAHNKGFTILMKRTLMPLWVIAALIGPLLFLVRWTEERQAMDHLAKASAEAPNVILITMDTVRAHSLSLYGYDRPTTPFLEQLAKKGVRFDWAIATAPWTIPSHASMFTGLPTADLVPRTERAISERVTTLAEVLRDQGYQTAGFVGNLYFMARDTQLSQGFVHYEGFRPSLGQLVLSFQPGRTVTNSKHFRSLIGNVEVLNRKPAGEVTHQFLEWLSEDRRPGPFFAFLNYFDAHEPYLPPEPYRTRFWRPGPAPDYRFDTYRADRVNLNDAPPESQLGNQLGEYEGQIAHIDAELSKLFGELQERGLFANTLLIVTADHGEAFGEHGLLGHFNNMYIQTLRVPLIVSFAGRVPNGVEVKNPVSLQDVPATVMDLIGLSNQFRFPGESLADFWQNPAAAPIEPIESRITGEDESRSVVKWPYHYLRLGEGAEALYDLGLDSQERQNLASNPKLRATLDQLRSLAD